MSKLNDRDLIKEASSKNLLSDKVIIELHARLLEVKVSEMSFVEFRALQLLNEKGVGISGLIKLKTQIESND